MAVTRIDAGVDVRLTVPAGTLIVGVFSVLAVSFWVLQVVQHAKFEEMAENNHQRTLALRAPRGMVFDRDGRVLVENRHSYSISIVREHTKDLEPHDSPAGVGARHRRERACARSSSATGASRPIGPIVDRAGRDAGAGGRGHRAAPRLRAARRRRRGGADAAVSRRRWPRTCSATSARSATRRWPTTTALKSGDIVGQSGIEKVYNALLMGEDGAKRVVVNSVGREIRTLEEDAADRRASGCS